jgi:hypothetical protein
MPRSAIHISPKRYAESPVPELTLGNSHTTSNALHDLEYRGDLGPWTDFLSAVKNMHETHAWRNKCIGLILHTLEDPNPYNHGNVGVGDEHGVLGRFHKYFGDILNVIFTTQSKGVRFADFKCVKSTYSGIPDVIMHGESDQLLVVGELKVPWVIAHDIDDKLDNEWALRKILAQPIMYMQDLKCVYGFLSNYKETIFLRQVVDNQGVWRIEYSPVILASDTYDRGEVNPPVVSARQCFFYLGLDALNQGPADNTTPQWVIRNN